MKRVKETFKSSEIAHVWTTQQYPVGRVSGGSNMSFDGTKFYSYSTCIAQIVTSKTGEKVYLISENNFSSTTSSHISAVRNAIPGYSDVFYFDNGARRGSSVLVSNANDVGNELYEQYQKSISETLERANKARENKGYLLSQVAQTQKKLNRIIELWQLDYTPIHNDEIKALASRADELMDEAQQKRNEKQERQYQKRLEEAQKRAAKLSGELEKWKNGERVLVSLYDCDTSLRIAPDNNDVLETSKGARITVATAKRLFPFAMAHRANGWRRNGERFKLDLYELDEINNDGIKAGCHFIKWNEIERMAKVLNLI